MKIRIVDASSVHRRRHSITHRLMRTELVVIALQYCTQAAPQISGYGTIRELYWMRNTASRSKWSNDSAFVVLRIAMKNIFLYQISWNLCRTNDTSDLSYICFCVFESLFVCTHRATSTFSFEFAWTTWICRGLVSRFWIFLIAYLRFVYACTLIIFIIQWRRICESILFSIWDLVLTVHCSNVVYNSQTGQFGTGHKLPKKCSWQVQHGQEVTWHVTGQVSCTTGTVQSPSSVNASSCVSDVPEAHWIIKNT